MVERPLKSVELASQAVVGLLRRLSIASRADELSLLGLDAEDITGVILNQVGVLVLKFLDLRHVLAPLMTHLLDLTGQALVGRSELLQLSTLHRREAA